MPSLTRMTFILTLVVLSLSTSTSLSAGEIEKLSLPYNTNSFDAAFDKEGNLHVIFARKGKMFFSLRKKNNQKFEKPVSIDPRGPRPVVSGAERRPFLAFGKGRDLYGLWQIREGMRFVVSRDGGESWKAGPSPRDTQRRGIDMPVMTTSADGIIYALWTDARHPSKPGDPLGLHLYMAYSKDRGKSFSKNINLTRNYIRACPCCQPAATTDQKGRLWVGYRSTKRGQKEHHLLCFVSERIITKRQVSRDNWQFKGCPMSGPRLAVGEKGRKILMVWTAKKRVWFRTSSNGGRSFGKIQRLGVGDFRALALAENGKMALLWDEGRQTGFSLVDTAKKGKFRRKRIPIRPRGRLLVSNEGKLYLVQGK